MRADDRVAVRATGAGTRMCGNGTGGGVTTGLGRGAGAGDGIARCVTCKRRALETISRGGV
jgi:hypothetical protein